MPRGRKAVGLSRHRCRSLTPDTLVSLTACGCSVHGQCDEGITGSGQCFCEAGWTGRFCDTLTGLLREWPAGAAPGYGDPLEGVQVRLELSGS